MAVFTSVEATEDTPNFLLVAKPSNVVVYLSAETIEERTHWVDALRTAIPKARKKLKVRYKSERMRLRQKDVGLFSFRVACFGPNSRI